MKKKKLTIIDGDSIAFIVSFKYSQDSSMLNNTNEMFIQAQVKDFVNNILSTTDADCYIGFVENRDIKKFSFREDLYPNYKGTRTKTDGLRYWLPRVAAYLVKEFNFNQMDDEIESDDAVCITYNRLKYEYDISIAHNDKDLKQIAMYCEDADGLKYYNFKKNEHELVTKEEGFYSYYCQIIKGDSNDAIIGLPFIGETKAPEVLDEILTKARITSNGILGHILEVYKQHFREIIPQRTIKAIIKEKTPIGSTKAEKEEIAAEVEREYSNLKAQGIHTIIDYFILQVKLITLVDYADEELLPNYAPIEYTLGDSKIELIDI